MLFYPFRALRADPKFAADIAAPPYDVVSQDEARRLAEGNPHSFLRISRPDLEFPDGVSSSDPAIYLRAAQRMTEFISEGWLCRDEDESFFLYRLQTADRAQFGIVGVCDVADYENGVIRKHEHTRPESEADRVRHTDAIDANAGPVWLFWKDEKKTSASWRRIESETPLYDLVRPDGVRHTIWRMPHNDDLTALFRGVPRCYIADGHHRAAAAARVAAVRRMANPQHSGTEAYNRFLAVIFPSDQLCIQPYNRMVSDLGGLSKKKFLDAVSQEFNIQRTTHEQPASSGRIAMYLDGDWYELRWSAPDTADPVSQLDVSILQNRLLAPILGIQDPRRDPRLIFRGGACSAQELADRVNRGEGAVVFSLHPVSVEQLMAVADAGLTMPPKSTWFEPKLLSGLLIHRLDSAIAR